MSEVTITLGEHEIPVYPQRQAYLANRLGSVVQAVVEAGGEVDADSLREFVIENEYEVLCALIPTIAKRIPKWEFCGFASAEAHAAGEYSDEGDKGPTIPEVREAFETGIKVNGLDLLKKVTGVVDPKLLKAIINERIATAVETGLSPTSASTSGTSESTSSSPNGSTSLVSAA